MKKIGVLLAIIFLILIPTILSLNPDDIENTINTKAEQAEKTAEQIEDIAELTEEDIKWDYLSQEIQKIMLKNKIISLFDKMFKKMDFLFVVLFGQHYSISLTLFTSIIIFFYIFESFREIFKNYSMLSEGISDAIAFLLCIITAQLGLYIKTAELMFKFIFYSEGWLAWLRFGIIIAILIALNYALRWGGKIQIQRKEEMEKFKTEMAQKTIQMTAKALKPINKALGRNSK